jgi:hypothetical protein
MKPIILGILFLIGLIVFNYKEGYTDCQRGTPCERATECQKKKIIRYVQSYPNSYSIDPLYEGKFKPECCPGPYTSSSGCLCSEGFNYSLLTSRGGNNYNFKYGSHKTPGTKFYKTN